MRTPAGTECQFFYGNYYRGREEEKCILIGNTSPPHNWVPELCKNCPVPEILRANACENMVLHAKVKSVLFGLKKKVEISAFCTKTKQEVVEPRIGCGECHPLPPVFYE